MAGETHDWTRGPAKWLGAGALGGAALVGLVWSVVARTMPPGLQEPDADPARAGEVGGPATERTGTPAASGRPGVEVLAAAGTEPLRETPAAGGAVSGAPGPPPGPAAAPGAGSAPPGTSGTPAPGAPATSAPMPGPLTPEKPAAPVTAGEPPVSVPRGGEGDPAVRPGAGGPAPASSILRKVNLNTATQAELESLPGIGPALARRIIDFRTSKGAFRRVDELDKVSGIGARTLEKLRPLVTVE